MKIAVIGSRTIREVAMQAYLPPETTELVSGGAKGVDHCVAEYARQHGVPLREFLPDYARYGRGAPLKRNEQIVDSADQVLVFWDGVSKGTAYTIDYCRKVGKPIQVVFLSVK